MTTTIRTLNIVDDDVVTPLTKAVVKQLPYWRDGCYTRDNVRELCTVLGTVSLPEEVLILIQTEKGLETIRMNTFLGMGLNRTFDVDLNTLQRFVLLK